MCECDCVWLMIVLVVECVVGWVRSMGVGVCVGAQGGGLEGYMFSAVIICIMDFLF